MRSRLVPVLLSLGALGAVAAELGAQGRGQDARPGIAVLPFENSGSYGQDKENFDALQKGIAGMLISELAANPAARVVERGQIGLAVATERHDRPAGVHERPQHVDGEDRAALGVEYEHRRALVRDQLPRHTRFARFDLSPVERGSNACRIPGGCVQQEVSHGRERGPGRPGLSRQELFTRWRPCCASVYSGKTARAR